MVFDHAGEHAPQWAAISSIVTKIGCNPETLRGWVRQAERDQRKRLGPKGRRSYNALAGTIDGLCRTAVIRRLWAGAVGRRRGPWRTLEAVEFVTLAWVDRFNHRRRFEPTGNSPPAEAEARSHPQTEAVAMVA